MAIDEKTPNKKMIVAIVLTVILLIIAITGTVVFLKDNGSSDAVNIAGTQNATENNSSNDNKNNDSNNTVTNENTVGISNDNNNIENNATTENMQNNTENNINSNTTYANNTSNDAKDNSSKNNTTNNISENKTVNTVTNNNTTSKNTNKIEKSTDSIKETTITRETTVVIPEQIVSEGHYVNWNPIAINVAAASSNIDANEDDVKIIKTANILTGAGIAARGDIIEYVITVTNNSDRELKAIEVTDKIPEQTIYEETQDNAEKTLDENNKVIALKWNIDIKKGETAELKFNVKVNEDATGTIKNIAITNGEESEEVKTSIVKVQKTSEIKRDGEIVSQLAKVGDEISYVISVENTGDADGLTTIKDAKLEDILSDGKAEVIGKIQVYENSEAILDNIEAKELINGLKGISVPANGKVEVRFTIKLNKISGKIINVATIGNDKNTNPEVNPNDEKDTIDISAVKTNTIESKEEGTEKTVKPGDTFKYQIKLTNAGNVSGKVDVEDEVPSELTIIKTTPEVSKQEENKLTWEEVEVSPETETILEIEVQVNKKATGTFKNVAVIGKEEVPDEEIKIEEIVDISAVKTNTIESKEEGTEKTVKPGDTFKYQIKLTNAGNVSGKVDVEDEVPSELTIIKTTPEASEQKENKLTWEEVEVSPETDTILEIEVQVKEKATGTFKNVAVVGEEEVPDEEIKIEEIVDISAVKTNTIESKEEGTEKTVKPGDTFKYQIKLTNAGNVSGKVDVEDEVPSELTIIKTTPEASKQEGNKLTWEEVKVSPETDTILEIEVQVKEKATGTFKNVAVIGEEKVPDEEIKIEEIVDISAVKTNTIESKEEGTEKTVKPGDKFKYQIKLTNAGNVSGKVDVEDDVPSELTIIKTTPEASKQEGNKLTWEEVEVSPETDTILEIEVQVKEKATGTFKNVAVIGKEEVPDEEIKIEEIVDISAVKTNTIESKEEGTEKTVKPGDKFKYQIRLTNAGNVSGKVDVEDEVPSELTIIKTTPEASEQKGNKLTWEEVKVSPETDTILEIEVQVKEKATGTFKNVAVIGEEKVPDEEIKIEEIVDISAVKTNTIESKEEGTEKTVKPGDKFKYQIRLTNAGNVSGKVDVEDEVPSELTIIKTTPEASEQKGNKLTWEEVKVSPETDTILEIEVQVKEKATGTFKNVAVIGEEKVPDEEIKIEEIVDISAVKTNTIESKEEGTEKTVKPGDKFKYQIRLTNAGNVSGKVDVEDEVPSELTIIKTTPEASEQKGNKLTWEEVKVSPETDTILEIEVQVKEKATGTFKNVAVIGEEKVPDEEIKIEEIVDISAVKTNTIESKEEGTEKTVKPGDKFKYQIRLTNAGNVSGKVDVEDDVPSELTIIKTTPEASEQKGNKLTWEEVKVSPETDTILEIEVQVKEKATGTFKNVAVIGEERVPDEEIKIEEANISVSKKQNKDQNAIVENGNEIIYTIRAENNGNVAGNVTITDNVPNQLEILSISILPTNRQENKLTWNISVEPNQPISIEIKARVIGYAGEIINNKAEYKQEGKNNTQYTGECITKIEDKLTVVSTTSETTENPIQQNVILVLDFSRSMKNEIGNLKSAVNLFAGTFLKNGVNTITVVEYANEIVNGTPFTTTSANKLAEKIKSHNIGSGTNIDAGLTTANGLISETSKNNIKPENTTVIVMTDGEPNWYWDDKGKKHSGSTTLCEAHAKLAAQKIKERGINIYSIGFDLNRSSAKEMMEKISSNYDKENTKKVSNKYYFESSKGEELIKNFTDISSTIISTTDSGIDKLVTNVGIAEIPSTLFEVGQDVEIYYPDMYQTGKSKSIVKYTWNDFINLKYTTYDGKNIKFDLANYMKDNNIVANGEVALRFVISESSTKKTSLSTNKEISSANVLSATINDVKEEKINTNNITEYENKLKESESQKKTENNNKTETTNTNKVVENITNNNTEIKNDTKTKIEENKTTVPSETNKNENTVKTEKENKTESNTNTDTKKAEETKTNVEKKATKQTENSKEQQSTKSKTENTLSNEKTENLKTNVEKNAKNNIENKTDLNKKTQNATNNSKIVETKSKTVEETTKQNKENTSNNISTKTQVTSK